MAPGAAARALKLHVVAPRQGAVWVRRGFGVLVRQPFGFAGLFAACLFGLMLVGLVPLLGSMAFAVLPLCALLFMVGTRRTLDDLSPVPGAFVEVARSGRPRLIVLAKLSLVCGLAILGVLWIGNIVDGGALEALQQSTASAEQMNARLADPALRTGVFTRLVLLLLIAIPAWHAPALVHWAGTSWPKALVFSAVACWRNKAAFAVYAVCWLAVWLVMAMIVSLCATLIGPTRTVAIVVPLSLAFWTAVGASLYFTFADCFQTAPALPEPDAEAI